MWEGKAKAITFSYDDGNEQDIKLVELFNKYNVKATFNINSGIQTPTRNKIRNDILIRRLNALKLKDLYKGHEVAGHGLTHASLADFDYDTIMNEVWLDKFYIEKLFDQKVNGFAYPNGTYNDTAVKVLEECGIRYARTVESSHSFALQDDLLRFHPTCHHDDKDVFLLIKDFLASKCDRPQLLYIWGHSYEFEINNNWDHMEAILKLISGQKDIFYGTNEEVLLSCKSMDCY